MAGLFFDGHGKWVVSNIVFKNYPNPIKQSFLQFDYACLSHQMPILTVHVCQPGSCKMKSNSKEIAIPTRLEILGYLIIRHEEFLHILVATWLLLVAFIYMCVLT